MSRVVCDGCGEDVTATGNCEDYRLVLASQQRTPWYVLAGEESGAVTAMAIPDPLPQSRHFCGWECLRLWLSRDRDGARGAS